jgi:hypothetical protein
MEFTGGRTNKSGTSDPQTSTIFTNAQGSYHNVPRWDQATIARSVTALTLSHAESTEYTESSVGADDPDSELELEDEDRLGSENGRPKRHKKRKMAESVYSFDSSKLSQFVKDINGRYESASSSSTVSKPIKGRSMS